MLIYISMHNNNKGTERGIQKKLSQDKLKERLFTTVFANNC